MQGTERERSSVGSGTRGGRSGKDETRGRMAIEANGGWVLGDKRRMEEGSTWSKISTDATDDGRATRRTGDRNTRTSLSRASVSTWNESKGRHMVEEEACWIIQNEDQEA